MHLLIFAILCSFAISALLKIYEQQGLNTQVVIASNYIMAALIGWAIAFWNGFDAISPITVLLGLGGGFLWPGGLYIMMYGIRHYGLSLAGSVRRLGLVVPITFGLIILGERLTLPIALGIALSVVAFFLLRPIKSDELENVSISAAWFFPAMVLYFGIVDLWVNLYNTYGLAEERFLFLTLIFTFSAVVAWSIVGLQRIQVERTTLAKGLVIGAPNVLTSFFLLEALKHPFFADITAVAYTLNAVLGVTLVFTAGALIWREPVSRSSVVGVLLAIAAIILLNV